MIVTGGCSHCGGDLHKVFEEYGEVMRCLQCSREEGGTVEVKEDKMEKPLDEMSNAERELYWDEHQIQILADLLEMTVDVLVKKWGFKSRMDWYALRKRWKSEGVPIPDLRIDDRAKARRLKAPLGEPKKPKTDAGIDWQLKYESYRQAVLDIFGKSRENEK